LEAVDGLVVVPFGFFVGLAGDGPSVSVVGDLPGSARCNVRAVTGASTGIASAVTIVTAVAIVTAVTIVTVIAAVIALAAAMT
jgi:hypothetical protein